MFLASPRDVLDERRIADEVVSDLKQLVGLSTLMSNRSLQVGGHYPRLRSAPQDRLNPDVESRDLFIRPSGGGARAILSSSTRQALQEEFERARARRTASGAREDSR